MNSSEFVTTLTSHINHYSTSAIVPRSVYTNDDNIISKFMGKPFSDGLFLCDICNSQLLLYFQLSHISLPLGYQYLLDGGVLQLYFCENECQSNPKQPFSGSSIVKIVDAITPRNSAEPSRAAYCYAITDMATVSDYPCELDYHLIGIIDSSDQSNNISYTIDGKTVHSRCINDMNKLPQCIKGNKILGWPLWIQHSDYMKCSICSITLRCLVQLDSDATKEFRFGDGGIGYILQCPKHLRELRFIYSCV